MSGQLQTLLPYLLIATDAGLIGGLIVLFWVPVVKARSAIQHSYVPSHRAGHIGDHKNILNSQ